MFAIRDTAEVTVVSSCHVRKALVMLSAVGPIVASVTQVCACAIPVGQARIAILASSALTTAMAREYARMRSASVTLGTVVMPVKTGVVAQMTAATRVFACMASASATPDSAMTKRRASRIALSCKSATDAAHVAFAGVGVATVILDGKVRTAQSLLAVPKTARPTVFVGIKSATVHRVIQGTIVLRSPSVQIIVVMLVSASMDSATAGLDTVEQTAACRRSAPIIAHQEGAATKESVSASQDIKARLATRKCDVRGIAQATVIARLAGAIVPLGLWAKTAVALCSAPMRAATMACALMASATATQNTRGPTVERP